jgi:hypothetical protein
MEIKRRLTRIAKSLSPQIEVMNVATEMDRMCDRFEELVNYAQEKIDRASERKGNTLASQADARRKAEEQIVFDAQKAEVEENQRDQQEAFDERNKDPGAVVEALEIEMAADEEADAVRPVGKNKHTKKKK